MPLPSGLSGNLPWSDESCFESLLKFHTWRRCIHKKTTKTIDTYVILVHFSEFGKLSEIEKPCFVLCSCACCGKKSFFGFGSSEVPSDSWFLRKVRLTRKTDGFNRENFFRESTQKSCRLFFAIMMPKNIPILYGLLTGSARCGGFFPQKVYSWLYLTSWFCFSGCSWMFLPAKIQGWLCTSLSHWSKGPDETHLALEIHFLALAGLAWFMKVNEGKLKRSFQCFGVAKTSPQKKMCVWACVKEVVVLPKHLC